MTNDKSETALYLASGRGNTDVVWFLLISDFIDVNIRTKNNDNSLIIATRNKHEDVVKLLLKKPVIIFKKNNFSSSVEFILKKV